MKEDKYDIEIPDFGKVIHEDYGIGQLADNHITIITSEDSQLASDARKAMDKLTTSLSYDALYNKYELDTFEDLELSGHPETKAYVDENLCNILVQIYTPGIKGKLILCAKTDTSDIEKNIALAIFVVDRIYHDCTVKVISGAIEDNPKGFEDYAVKKVAENSQYEKSLLDFPSEIAEGISNIIKVPLGINAMRRDRIMSPEEPSEDGLQSQRKHFLKMLKEYRHHPNPQLLSEITKVVETVPPQLISEYLVWCSTRDQQRFAELTPDDLAKKSTLQLTIKYIGKTDPKFKNDGKYRLYLTKGDYSEMVHFNRKNSCILYFLYLIDRKKRGDNAEALDLNEYREKFNQIYYQIYGDNSAIASKDAFDNMMKELNKKDRVKQADLSSVMKCMRDDIGRVCEKLHEPSSPFIIQNAKSHLAAMPNKISIPQELLDIL